MRDPATQTSPLFQKMPQNAACNAASRFASAKTMLGDLPPSSIVRCFIVAAPVRAMPWPTPVLPVKATLSMRGSFTSASPRLPPGPVSRP